MTGASIWIPGDSDPIPTANADNTYMTQSFLGSDGVVAGGNTIFTLTEFAYVIATGSLDVYINGVHQDITDDFTEPSNTTVTIIGLLEAGDEITIRGLIGGTAAVAAEVSAAAALASELAAEAAYDAILGLSLPSLPLSIAEGGTGQDTATEAFHALAPAPVINKVMGSVDGVSWTATDVIVPGTGGVEIVASVTLTATSDGAQSFTPTDYGQYYKLPDATSMDEGTNRFSLGNPSPYPIKILNASDVLIGFVPAWSVVYVSLVNKGTAAGVWSLAGAVPIAVTSKTFTRGLTAANNLLTRVVIDATRTMILAGQGGANNCYAQVHDSSTNTWGAVVLVRAAVNFFQAVLSAANQVLVVSCTTGTAMESVTLTIAGVGITVNAAVATAIATNVASVSSLTVVGIYFVVGYTRTTGGAVRGISIAGTVPTLSAESALTGTATVSNVQILPVTGTVFIAVNMTLTTTVYTKPFTLSVGPALAAGTETSFSASEIPRIYAQNGRWFIVTHNSANLFCRILSIAGTIASVTAAVNGASFGQVILSFSDAYVLGSKLVIAYCNNDTTMNFSIFTDTAGVLALGGTVTHPLAANLAASLLSFIFANGNTIVFSANASLILAWKIDASGAAPVISATRFIDDSSSEVSTPAPSSITGVRSQLLLRTTNAAYTLTPSVGERIIGYTQNELFPIHPLELDIFSQGVSGYDNETWLGFANAIGATGLAITRIECAAY